MNPFYQRSFLRLLDFSSAEIQQLLALSLELKQAKKSGHEQQYLTGKNIALIFEKIPPVPVVPLKWPPLIKVRM